MQEIIPTVTQKKLINSKVLKASHTTKGHYCAKWITKTNKRCAKKKQIIDFLIFSGWLRYLYLCLNQIKAVVKVERKCQ